LNLLMVKRQRTTHSRSGAKSKSSAKTEVALETAIIGTLISDEARRVTPLMSKVYLALLVAPPKYWDRHDVLHLTGEQHEGEWRTA
jgi:hypothetical protein